jgi:hypothetical protein
MKTQKVEHATWEEKLMPSASLILPYTVPEKTRKKKFDINMELTAILCLVEARRKRHVMGRFPQEKISFISKLHYPLWTIPWENGCLIIDGLQTLSSTLTYMALPDMELFFNDIERGQTFREQFQNALDKHAQTFAGFSETVRIPMEAIVTDKVLLSDVSDYVEETLALKADVTGNIILIPPKLDEDATCNSVKKVLDLYERIQSDVKSLEHAARVLNEMTLFHGQKILREIELVNEAFKEEVDKVKPIVEKKVGLLLKERDAKIEKMNRAAEAELNAKLREKERRQRELEKLELNHTEYKRRLEVRRSRHDKIGVARWEHSLRTCENKISEVKERTHGLSRYIEKIRKQNQEDLNKLKYSFQTLLDRERKKIVDIEASLESVIKVKEGESEKLRLMTRHIVSFIEQLAEQKRLHAAELKSLTVPWKSEQVTLLGVPFYLVGYKAQDRLHYRFYPPFRVMSSEGIVKKIEKTFLSFRLESRIKLLLQPRSKTLNKMFNTVLEEKMKTDRVLEENLRELGVSNNLLTNANFKEALTKGMEELKAEGWIKPEEGAILIKMYA